MTTASPDSSHAQLAGTLYALAAFLLWGVLPAYWKLLGHMPALEILSHRIFWSCVFVSAILLVKGQWLNVVRPLANPRQAVGMVCSTLLISLNWFLYIWAVNSAHMVEASMGYYINPLISVALGVLVFRERFGLWERIALGLATVGVLIVTVSYGRFPWISLTLAFSFGLYGLVKKLTPVGSLAALGLETLLMAPLCLFYIGLRGYRGVGAFGASSWQTTALLVFAGVVTALPLFWFAQAAKLIPLSRVGFLQYLAPSLMLLLGVLVYGEQFTRAHLLSFGCIWCALLIYSGSQAFSRKRRL
jgi:chloramphenicol-sensitive protein RarD